MAAPLSEPAINPSQPQAAVEVHQPKAVADSPQTAAGTVVPGQAAGTSSQSLTSPTSQLSHTAVFLGVMMYSYSRYFPSILFPNSLIINSWFLYYNLQKLSLRNFFSIFGRGTFFFPLSYAY